MSELYHLGISQDSVTRSAVIVDRDVMASVAVLSGWAALRDRREYINGVISGVVICGGAYGGAAAIIALEELSRAGATDVVGIARCWCSTCRRNGEHSPVIPVAAVRGEQLSHDYAPTQFPAVPDYVVRTRLQSVLPAAKEGLAHTHDLEPEGVTDSGVLADDLWSAPFYVVGAARRMRVATVLVPASYTVDSTAKLVNTVVQALASMATSGGGHT